MNINTYSFYPIDSKMYVILENKKALIIDPCVSEEAKEYLKSEQVKEILVLLTHEHYDHISGVNWLRECFPQVKVFCSEACANGIVKPTRNLSAYYEILFSSKEEEIREYVKNMDVQPYSCQADETYEGRKEWNWEGHKIVMQETPGHSKGSSCILMDDMYLFSGDTLVTGHETILRLPGSSKKDFANITVPYLESLDKEIMVYPGHGKPQKLAEFMR